MDSDNDELSNIEEYNKETNIQSEDSNTDSINDLIDDTPLNPQIIDDNADSAPWLILAFLVLLL